MCVCVCFVARAKIVLLAKHELLCAANPFPDTKPSVCMYAWKYYILLCVLLSTEWEDGIQLKLVLQNLRYSGEFVAISPYYLYT